MCRFCPNCGYDVARYDREITVGRLTVTEAAVLIDGNPVNFTGDQVNILRTLALAYPNPVGMDALILRLGKQELEQPDNVIAVQVHRIRTHLSQFGLPTHTLQNLKGRGYMLTVPLAVAA